MPFTEPCLRYSCTHTLQEKLVLKRRKKKKEDVKKVGLKVNIKSN